MAIVVTMSIVISVLILVTMTTKACVRLWGNSVEFWSINNHHLSFTSSFEHWGCKYFFAFGSKTSKSTCIVKSCKTMCFCKVSTLARIAIAILEVDVACAFSTTSWTFPSLCSSFICRLHVGHFVIFPPWEGMAWTITSTLKSSPSSCSGPTSWIEGHGCFMGRVLSKLSSKSLHLDTSFNKSQQWIKQNPKFFGYLCLYNSSALWRVSSIELPNSFKEITLP